MDSTHVRTSFWIITENIHHNMISIKMDCGHYIPPIKVQWTFYYWDLILEWQSANTPKSNTLEDLELAIHHEIWKLPQNCTETGSITLRKDVNMWLNKTDVMYNMCCKQWHYFDRGLFFWEKCLKYVTCTAKKCYIIYYNLKYCF
jgi:hypothetical protein